MFGLLVAPFYPPFAALIYYRCRYYSYQRLRRLMHYLPYLFLGFVLFTSYLLTFIHKAAGNIFFMIVMGSPILIAYTLVCVYSYRFLSQWMIKKNKLVISEDTTTEPFSILPQDKHKRALGILGVLLLAILSFLAVGTVEKIPGNKAGQPPIQAP